MTAAPAYPTAHSRLQARRLSVAYDSRPVLQQLDLDLPDRAFTVIIGPNGCGKSTLLRTLARLVRPQQGSVLLDGTLIHQLPTREVARRMGMLTQSAHPPEGIRVQELVARGRHPHQTWLGGWTEIDQQILEQAMKQADVLPLADRTVDTLSGGQRQRVWLAMALAQNTPLLLLDEPTTYLDLSHQVALMHLLRRQQRDHGRTLVAVLHDLNQACRHADHLVVMHQGRIVAQGTPETVISTTLIEEVFDLRCCLIRDPVAGTPLIVPVDPPSPQSSSGAICSP